MVGTQRNWPVYNSCELLIREKDCFPEIMTCTLFAHFPVLALETCRFTDCEFFNQNMNEWDVSNVQNMFRTFSGARRFNGDISTWNVENVNNFRLTFWQASSFNSDITRWNPKSASSTEGMFSDTFFFNVDISGWDMSSVQNGESMFEFARAFNQDLSRWVKLHDLLRLPVCMLSKHLWFFLFIQLELDQHVSIMENVSKCRKF